MKDNYGDKIDVQTHDESENVYLGVRAGASYADASLTPAKARKLAKKLRRAADEVDGGEQVTFDDVKHLFEAPRYLLDLTQAEAETLAVILYKVGGPTGEIEGTRPSARVHADTVADKLKSVGLDAVELAKSDSYQTEPYSSIYFQVRA